MFGNYKISGLNKKKVALFDFRNSVNGLIDGHIAKNTLADVTYNFNFHDGALKDGVGVKDLSVVLGGVRKTPILPKDFAPQKVYFYSRFDEERSRRDDRLLILFDDGNTYEWKIYSDSAEMTLIEGLPSSWDTLAVNYRLNSEDCLLISTDSILYVYNGVTVTAHSAPRITSMTIHNERLFITTKDTPTQLWYSDTFDPTNWNVSLEEAGFIDFQNGQGRLLDVKSLNGYLYVFGSYAICRVVAYGDQTEMSVETIFLNSGRIIEGSITACGNRIIYLAEDGFYSFDGTSSHRILPELDKYIDGLSNADITAAYYNGNFYAAINVWSEGVAEKSLLVYDVYTKDFYLARGIPAFDLKRIDGDGFSKLAVITEDRIALGELDLSGCYYGTPLKKLWRSCNNDFSLDGIKSVQKISLFTQADVTVKVISEKGSKTVEFKGSANRQCKFVGLKGTDFRVEISSSAPGQSVSKIFIELLYF